MPYRKYSTLVHIPKTLSHVRLFVYLLHLLMMPRRGRPRFIILRKVSTIHLLPNRYIYHPHQSAFSRFTILYTVLFCNFGLMHHLRLACWGILALRLHYIPMLRSNISDPSSPHQIFFWLRLKHNDLCSFHPCRDGGTLTLNNDKMLRTCIRRIWGLPSFTAHVSAGDVVLGCVNSACDETPKASTPRK